jgi:hypothetical protein
MTKDYRAVPADEVIGMFPAARRERIKERAEELIADDLGAVVGRDRRTAMKKRTSWSSKIAGRTEK